MSRTNQEGQGLIKSWEALRLEAYHCSAGVCTIGWGSTSYTDGSPIKIGDKISEATAQTLFEYHLKKAEDGVSSALMKPVSDNEFSAMVSLCYNIGANAFRKSTLVKLLNLGEDKIAVADQFLVWIHSKGKIEKGLIKRRHDERLLFLKE